MNDNRHAPEPMHDEIWLQCPNKDGMSEWFGDVTWCDSPQNDDDTKYVRSDLHESVKKQRDELLAALEKIAKHYEDKCGLDATPSKRAEAWRLDYHNVKGIAINALASVKGGAA